MITIKMMRQGESWIGEMNALAIPRVGEVVYLGDQKAYPVIQVAFEPSGDGIHMPMLVLGPAS